MSKAVFLSPDSTLVPVRYEYNTDYGYIFNEPLTWTSAKPQANFNTHLII